MPFMGMSLFTQLRSPFEPDFIKNRAQKPAEMVRYSITEEHVLQVTALTSSVIANSNSWYNTKDGHSSRTSAHDPQQKNKSNIHPRRSLATTQKLKLATAVLVSIPICKDMTKNGYTGRISFSVSEERH